MTTAGGRWSTWRPRLELIAVGILASVFIWKGFLVGWASLNTDFPNYYLGGRLFRAGWPLERLNDWIWMQRQKDHAGLDQGLVGYLPSTFWSSLMIVPLTWLPPLAAKRVWLVLNLGLLVGVVLFLRRLTQLPHRRIALVVLLAIVPLRTNFQFGQQHVVVLFLLCVAAWAYFEERPLLSGIALALAASLKLYPALFLLFFVRKRRWRPLVALVGALLVLGVLDVVLFGFEGLRDYLLRILPRSLRGEYNDPYIPNLNSLTTLLRRLFIAEPELNPAPLVHAPRAFVILQPLLQALVLVMGVWAIDTGRSTADKQKLDWAAFCLLLLLLSTGMASYHLCALILPAALVFNYFAAAGQARHAWWTLAAWLLICLPYARIIPASPSGWRILFAFPRLYPLLALWLLAATTAWRWRAQHEGRRGRSAKAIAVASFAAAAALSVMSAARHFDGQFANYPSRIALPTTPLIATTPALAGGGVFFTRMDDEGYVVDRIGQTIVTSLPRGTDLFFPTGTPTSRDVWCELASTSSKVVRFPGGLSRLTLSDLVVEIEDGQQPAISADGRWLGFIREQRGRGALWVLDRSAAGPAGLRSAERRLLDATHDVLDFSFLPDGRIVLASDAGGLPSLSVLDPRSGQLARLETSDRPARYPAASPDGRWLAYAELERGQWQLWTMDLQTRERRQLTAADCNSVMPSWSTASRTLVFASDCARGIGHTALFSLRADDHLPVESTVHTHDH